jgi:tRNA guanosine-2'-O-methyltransferase
MTKAPDLENLTKDEIRLTLDEVRMPFSIAVWGSTNYFNMGSVIRTSHCFLAKEIFLIDIPGGFYKKATMGTHKWENLHKVNSLEFLDLVGNRPIIAFEKREGLDAKDLQYFQYPQDPILLFGCEKEGVPSHLLERASDIVYIPMWGLHNDFNLAVAVGMALYDWRLKRERNL